MYERSIPFSGTEWMTFLGQSGFVTTLPEDIGHPSAQGSYQNMILWLVSLFEERIMLEVDSLYKYNFIQRLNCINGTTFGVGDYNTADSRFPAVARLNDPCWGCNGSGFELLLKKIGSYDWWFDTTTPYTPVDVLNYRAKNNSPRAMMTQFGLRTQSPLWREAAIPSWLSTIQAWSVGHVVLHNTLYYRCHTAHNDGGTFNAARWTQVSPFDGTYRLISEDDW